MNNTQPFSNFISIILKKYIWFPLLIFSFHILASLVGLYEIFPYLDIPMHFLGGLAIAYFINGIYKTANNLESLGNPGQVYHYLLVFTSVSTIAVFWEFTEFLSDLFFHTHAQLGLTDTLKDILLGMVGGSILILLRIVKKFL